MPPTPQSSFVFDTQAWSSMASQLSVMALGREAAKTAAHYGGGREVPAARGITRSKSSDFLEQTLNHDAASRREAPARRAPAVTATRSKSLYVPKSKSKKNNLGVDSTPGGEEKCTIHPKVKLRRNRCPRCAAGEMVRRKSSGSLEAITAILDESQAGQACQTADKENYVDAANELNGEEEIEEVPLDEKWAKILQETRDADVVEEVSLDDKWADALRMISQRLANQKSEESGDADHVDGRQSFTEPFEQDDNSPRASVEEGLDDRDRDPYPCQELHNPSRLTINELKETIERAYAPPNTAEYEDEVSQSSLARGTKVFAESKGRPQAPRDPLSSPESELLEGTEVMLPRDDSSVRSYHSSGSESSVTLSIASEYTLETYNSLTAPPVRVDSLLPPARSNETYRSPTSVQNVMRSYHNRDEEDSVEEDEEDEDFESSFITSGAKTYSETKASTSLNSANNALHPDSSMPSVYEQLNNSTSTQNEQIIVEDVADESDDEEAAEAPAPARRKSVPTRKAAQVIVEDVTESDEEETVAAPTPTKSTSSSKPVTPTKPRPTQRSRSRSKSRSRNLETGKTEQPTRRKSSFFSALVHNSRSRSQSRQRRSSSRSKSRTRTPVEDIQDGGGDDEAGNSAPSSKAEQPTRRKSQPSFFSALVHNSRSRSSSRARKSSSRSKSRGRGDGGTKEQVESKRGISSSNAPAPVPRREEPKKVNPPVFRPEVAKAQESAAPAAEAVSREPDLFFSQGRGPITHPNYKLGDQAREEDMLVLPTHKPRKSRSRRRRRTVDSSSSSDSEDEEEYQYRKSSLKVDVKVAIGQLRHLDAAFVKRSDGTWTYALVADGDDNQIRFVVNDRGSTKSYPAALWKSCIRRIRVLTPRQGDRFALNTESSRKKRTLGRSRSFRGKGKGRFVSPSPTRRNVGVLNLPPTIMEEREYNH